MEGIHDGVRQSSRDREPERKRFRGATIGWRIDARRRDERAWRSRRSDCDPNLATPGQNCFIGRMVFHGPQQSYDARFHRHLAFWGAGGIPSRGCAISERAAYKVLTSASTAFGGNGVRLRESVAIANNSVAAQMGRPTEVAISSS